MMKENWQGKWKFQITYFYLSKISEKPKDSVLLINTLDLSSSSD